MLRKLKWQLPGEPLTARYFLWQGPVPGRGPAVDKHGCSDVLNNVWHLMIGPIGRGYFCPLSCPPSRLPPSGPNPPHYWSFQITHGRTHLDEWSARRGVLYLTTLYTQHTDIQAPYGIRTRDLSKRGDAGPHRTGTVLYWYCTVLVLYCTVL
jgi:hypothetical protein